MLFQEENVLNVLAAIHNQNEKEKATKVLMVEVLNQEGLEEDDIPQNYNLGTIIRNVVKKGKNMYTAIETLDLDYIEVANYKCFKVDDEASGAEEIYFISPTDILYLENSCLSIF